MLVRLRREQAFEQPRLEPETFKFQVVAGLEDDGHASEANIHHLDTCASWADMQNILTKLTTTAFAKSRDHANGYSLKDGKWLCRRLNTNKATVGKFQNLVTWEDYRGMRRRLDGGEWAGVLVVHESVQKEVDSKKSTLAQKSEKAAHEQLCHGHEEGWRWSTDEDYVGFVGS